MSATNLPDPKDNERLLCQDCSRPLFRWFLSRIDWRRILKEMFG